MVDGCRNKLFIVVARVPQDSVFFIIVLAVHFGAFSILMTCAIPSVRVTVLSPWSMTSAGLESGVIFGERNWIIII